MKHLAAVAWVVCIMALFAASAQAVETVLETARDIPLATSVDVVVVGGTTGAVSAALEAAKTGAKVFVAAPQMYLGEDLAGTLRLWLEEGETPASQLAVKLYTDIPDEPLSLHFTYTADKPSQEKHKDTSPPSRLSDNHPARDAVKDSVQYNEDVTITGDFGAAKDIKELRIVSFTGGDYGVASISAEISDDSKKWKKLGDFKPANMDKIATTGVPVEGRTRYFRLKAARANNAARMLLGKICAIPADNSAAGAVTARPLHVKKTLENALVAAKVDFLFGCFVSDVLLDKQGKPCGVVMVNRAGRQAVLAKTIVDATENALVARLAGAKFSEFQAGAKTVKWTVIANKPCAAKGVSVRKIPLPVIIHGGKSDGTATPAAAWYEYTLEVDIPADTWASRAAVEQIVRDKTYTKAELYTADMAMMIPPCSIRSVRPVSDDISESMNLDALRPLGVERVWILGGCADVPREQAGKFMRPIVSIDVGRRVGQVAAQEALKLPAPEGVMIAGATSTGKALPGEVKESLAGLRNAPEAARIPQPARNLPVLGTYDVVVIGGGTAGAPAGIGAARQGAKTLVVEYLHGLGGVGTLGMIAKYWYGNRVGFTDTVPSGPAELRMEFLRSELRKAGADIWLGAMGCGAIMDGKRVIGAVVATPMGRGVVLAKTVIDATGNSEVAAAGGAAVQFVQDDFALQASHIPPREVGSSYINGDRAAIDAADPLDVTHAMLDKNDLAFDWGQIIDSRERQRIVGDYTLDWLDIANYRTFPDSITLSTSDYDSHGYQMHPFFMLRTGRPPGKPRHAYWGYTPYRCLLPNNMEGILVVGLGMSAHRDAMPITRMQPDLQNQGYAAGVAASMAVKAGVGLRQIDIKTLQKHLVQMGNLPASVLTDSDSYPMPRQKIASAVQNIPNEFTDLEIVLAQPADSLPMLRKAHQAAEGKNKLAYAHVLGIMQDASGLDTLMSEARTRLNDPAAKKLPDKGAMDDLARLMWAMGGTGDKRVAPVLCGFIEKGYCISMARRRAAVVSLGRLADPSAAATLAQLIKPGDVKTGERDASPANLIVACALLRCGDKDGLARQTLEQISRGPNGPFARLAQQVLGDAQDKQK